MSTCGLHEHYGPTDRPGCQRDRPPTLAAQLRAKLRTDEEMRNYPPPVPLLDGLLYRNTLAAMYGPTESMKSFVGQHMSRTITSSLDFWHGHRVHHGPVLYVVAEGASGVGQRIRAWDLYHDTEGDVTWLPEAINIYSPAWA